MYQYHRPKPLVIKLTDDWGFDIRQKAADFLKDNKNTTGAERGNIDQQGSGLLAEMVVRSLIGIREEDNDDNLAYDILLPTGVKIDVKCRGGARPFQEEYLSDDGIMREAKHNLFARQVFDDKLDTDIYLMTHLETPNKASLPGTRRQRKWILYICGWVSKERAKIEGVYLPRHSLTEQGNTWFTYRGQEIEFYNKNLNGLEKIEDVLVINKDDVEKDENHKGDLNMTSVDAIRIVYDLVGRGILKSDAIDFVKKELQIDKTVKPILSTNQYHHLLQWLKERGYLFNDKENEKLIGILEKVDYTGI